MLWPSPAWNEVTYWALDLETGGLDPRRDAILSVGMVPVRQGTIRLGEAFSTLVRPEDGSDITSDSVRIHQLLPAEVVGAPPLPDVLREIDRRLAGSVLLVHHAGIDVRFLRRAHQAMRMPWPRPKVVDTVELLARAARKAHFIDPDASSRHDFVANLSAARQRYHLPEYSAHDALTDAIAAAELFLVLRRALGARRLSDLT